MHTRSHNFYTWNSGDRTSDVRAILEGRESARCAHPNVPQEGCLGAGMMGRDGWGLGAAIPSLGNTCLFGSKGSKWADPPDTPDTPAGSSRKEGRALLEGLACRACRAGRSVLAVQRYTALLFDPIQSAHRRGHRRESLVTLALLVLHGDALARISRTRQAPHAACGRRRYRWSARGR